LKTPGDVPECRSFPKPIRLFTALLMASPTTNSQHAYAVYVPFHLAERNGKYEVPSKSCEQELSSLSGPLCHLGDLVISLLLNCTFVATTARVVLSIPNCSGSSGSEAAYRIGEGEFSFPVLAPAMIFSRDIVQYVAKGIDNYEGCNYRPVRQDYARRATPPFMPYQAKSFPTVAPTPAPTPPSPTDLPALEQAAYAISPIGNALGGLQRQGQYYPRSAQMGTRVTPTSNPMLLSSRYLMTPPAASRPKALRR